MKRKRKRIRADLTNACLQGNLKKIKMDVQKFGIDILRPDIFNSSPVNAACWAGQYETVKMLFSLGHSFGLNLDLKPNTYMLYLSPLQSACQKGHTRVAQFLIENGYDYTNSSDTMKTQQMKDTLQKTLVLCHENHSKILDILSDNLNFIHNIPKVIINIVREYSIQNFI